MKVIFSAICLVVGVLLVMWGRNMAYSLSGHVSYMFTGSPGDKPMYLFVGGGVLIVIGLYQLVWNQK